MWKRKAGLWLTIGLATAAIAAGPDSKPKDPRVCRDAAELGTRIRSSECHLKSEWVAIDAARHKEYEDFNARLNGNPANEMPPPTSPVPH